MIESLEGAQDSTNDAGTCMDGDTLLTRQNLDLFRRDLIVMRNKHGANSAIGCRCSNIVELIQMPELPQAQYDKQMADLRKLLAAAEPAASRASHYS